MELSDILLILGGVLFVVLLVAAWEYVDHLGKLKADRIKREGSQTTGKVTATQTRERSYSRVSGYPVITNETTLDYEYEANGRRFTGTYTGGDSDKKPRGSTITVWYLPESRTSM